MTVFTINSQLSLFAIQWQDMFSLYLESFTPAFCAEAPEAESVN